MTKCPVGSARKRSAGSKSVAPCTSAQTHQSASASIVRAALKGRTTGARGWRRFTGGSSKHDAEDQRREAEQGGADEEQSVGVDERTAARQVRHPRAGEAL